MIKFKTASVAILSLCLTTAFAQRHPGHGNPPPHGHPPHHGNPPHHGHPPHHDDGDDDAAFFSLGALLGSLAVSSTAEAVDDAKDVIDRSDSIVQQILNNEMPEAFYSGFRTQEKYRGLDSYEIDLVLLETLSSL